jgi:putative copper export protein
MTLWYTSSLVVHLIAIALWLGGIVFFLVVVGPAVHELEPRIAVITMNQARLGLETMSWIAITLIFVTGLFNLLTKSQIDPIALSGAYLYTLSAKMLLFVAMVVHHCLQVFKYAPRIASLTNQSPPASATWPEPLLSNWQRWFLLLKLNAALGPIVVLLGLTLTKN